MKSNHKYDGLFIAALAINVLFVTFSRSIIFHEFFRNSEILIFIRFFIFCLLLMKIALDLTKISFVTLFIFAIIGCQTIISGDKHILYLFMFALAGQDIDFLNTCKTMAITIGCSLCIVIALFVFGLSPEVVMAREGSLFVRHSLGFINPNTFGGLVLVFIYSYIYINNKINYKKIILYSLFVGLFYVISGCRGLLLGVLSLCMGMILFSNSYNQQLKKILILLYPIFVIFYLIFLFQFSNGPVEGFLDDLFTKRFSMVSPWLQNNPITIFGDTGIFDGIESAFDNSYAWYILNCGIVGITVLVCIIVLGLLNNISSPIIVSMGLSVCGIGIIESTMYDVTMAFPLIKIISDGINSIKLVR